jgi:hypothetical protein
MKVCYCDESGTGDEPIAVMVGVIVDSQRMHVTKEHWSELLNDLSGIVGRQIREIHTRDFYAGNGVWRDMPGPKRADAITSIFDWLAARKHHIVFSSVLKSTYFSSLNAGRIPPELTTPWRFIGCHLLLAMQREFQRHEKNKGNTIFVFDNEEREKLRFTDLVANPPAWTDSYYGKKKKQGRFDQIVDVPYFGDSVEVALLQVADFLAYFLRRYSEIVEGLSAPNYPQEPERINGWINTLKTCAISASSIYPVTGRCDCAELFYSHAPGSLRALLRS